MRIVDDFTRQPAFEVFEANAPRVPFVFNAPHSGTLYPRAFIRHTKLDRRTLRRSEDTYVDELFATVPRLGAPLMRANFPRSYLDLNREADELDPEMFDAPLGLPVNADSPRVAGGLGVIARIVGERQEIYADKLAASEATRRIETLYRPYHARLEALLAATRAQFGVAVLIDCHSMPSGAVRLADASAARPDVVVGDRFGTSAGYAISDQLARELNRVGLVVGRNRPYAGGHITERYGAPPTTHALQIEINRSLYMDEATYERTARFDALQHKLVIAFAALIDWFGSGAGEIGPLAAE